MFIGDISIVSIVLMGFINQLTSMGDLQDPNEWRYVSTIFLQYFVGIFPEIKA